MSQVPHNGSGRQVPSGRSRDVIRPICRPWLVLENSGVCGAVSLRGRCRDSYYLTGVVRFFFLI